MIESPARPATTTAAPAPTYESSETRRALAAAAATLGAFFGLAALVTAGWTMWLDDLGRPLAGWATAQGLDPLLRDLEGAFGRVAMTVYAVVLVVFLLVARAPRLAAFTAVATFVTAHLTGTLKDLVGRSRPEWQLTDGHHATFAFPSGHASSVAALAGVLVVVTWVLSAGHPARQTITSLVAGVGAGLLLVIAADRVLLGRHFPTDVLGGALLGAVVVLLSAAALGVLERGDRQLPADAEPSDDAERPGLPAAA